MSNAAEVLTAEQVAELCAVHPDTVYRLASAGRIPARRVGRQWRFLRSTRGDGDLGEGIAHWASGGGASRKRGNRSRVWYSDPA